jgi:predicted Zn finger-like uncharacterized protein
MILTCPECATSYFVEGARIPPEGRRVKCTSCGARWLAQNEDAPQPISEPAASAEPLQAAAEAAAHPADEPRGAHEVDDLVVVEPEPRGPERRGTARPAPVRTARKSRSAAAAWVGVAAVVAALIAAAIVFRADLVRVWPQSSAAFSGVGLEVADGGLIIEAVNAKAVYVNGRPALEVSGAIRNPRNQTSVSPPLRVSLLDRAGKPVAAHIATPVSGAVPPREKRFFSVAIVDPPSNAHDLEVRFEPAGKGAQPKQGRETHSPAGGAHHG